MPLVVRVSKQHGTNISNARKLREGWARAWQRVSHHPAPVWPGAIAGTLLGLDCIGRICSFCMTFVPQNRPSRLLLPRKCATQSRHCAYGVVLIVIITISMVVPEIGACAVNEIQCRGQTIRNRLMNQRATKQNLFKALPLPFPIRNCKQAWPAARFCSGGLHNLASERADTCRIALRHYCYRVCKKGPASSGALDQQTPGL